MDSVCSLRGTGTPWKASALALALVVFAAPSNPAGGETPNLKAPPQIDIRFVQVHPEPEAPEAITRSPGQRRAVVLLHGFQPNPLTWLATRARLSGWQQSDSKLVKAMSQVGDVYAVAYSQNARVENVAHAEKLRDGIRRLREENYEEIVLLGHSAGGLIARHFVEDFPDSGVAKVIQLCSPNTGCGMARLDWLCLEQRVFVDSLGKRARRECLTQRQDRRIPPHVQFVCVVGDAAGSGDLLVSDDSQWPPDLRQQGIPAVRFWTGHFWVTYNRSDARKIAELVAEDHPRWHPAKVAAMKKKILGD